MLNPTLQVSSRDESAFSRTPGYFGLAIIAAAIDLRIAFAGRRRTDGRFVIDLPDLGERRNSPWPGNSL